MEHLNLNIFIYATFWTLLIIRIIQSALHRGTLLLYQIIIGCYYKLNFHFHPTKIIKILVMRISRMSLCYDRNIYTFICEYNVGFCFIKFCSISRRYKVIYK